MGYNSARVKRELKVCLLASTITVLLVVGNSAASNALGPTRPSNASSSVTVPPTTTAPLNNLNPSPDSNPDVNLAQVSCPAAGWCVAIGTYVDDPTSICEGESGLIETLSKGTWAAESAPLGGLNPPAQCSAPSLLSSLSSVSCTAVGACVAVGAYAVNSGHELGLIETLSRGGWTAETAPMANLSPSSAGFSYLSQVACGSTRLCVADGTYIATIESSQTSEGLVETFSKKVWSDSNAQLSGLSPPAASLPSDPKVFLTALSCAGSFCVIGGTYDDQSGNPHGLINSLSQGAWSAITAPVANLNPPLSAGATLTLESLNCLSTEVCRVVGSYNDNQQTSSGLLLTLKNGRWKDQTQSRGNTITCVAADSCQYIGDEGPGGLITGLANKIWTTIPAPVKGLKPPPTTGSNQQVVLQDVACISSTSCEVVGRYGDASNNEHGYLAVLKSGTWLAVTMPTRKLNPGPDSDPTAQLTSVSCPVVNACVAVGSYLDNSGDVEGVVQTPISS